MSYLCSLLTVVAAVWGWRMAVRQKRQLHYQEHPALFRAQLPGLVLMGVCLLLSVGWGLYHLRLDGWSLEHETAPMPHLAWLPIVTFALSFLGSALLSWTFHRRQERPR